MVGDRERPTARRAPGKAITEDANLGGPVLSPFELGWINFAVLRRSHSTLHKQRNSDSKIIADQQGHGMRTHLDDYVQSGVAERKAEASKLYADFIGVLRKRG